MLKRLNVVIVPFLIIALSMASFFYFKSTKPQQAPVEVKEKVWMVEAMGAKFEDLAPSQTLYGTVESYALVTVSAPISALVDKVAVKDGDEPKRGALLLELDDQDLRLPVEQASADVEDIKAQIDLQLLANKANQQRLEHEQKVLELKREKVTRTQQLLKKNLASQSAVDDVKEALVRQEYSVVGAQLSVQESRLKLDQLKAKLAKAKAVLAQAKLNRQRGKVEAPYDARIAKVSVSEGSRVNAGSALLSYYALSSLELRAQLPASEVDSVEQALRKGESYVAYVQTGSGSKAALPLLRLSGEASTSGVDAFFDLSAAGKDLRPGDLMEINLRGAARSNLLALPYSAIYGKDRIYLIEKDRLAARTVTLVGEVQRDGRLWALIEPNFPEGSRVCITHLPNAVTGLKVSEVTE
ncbi:efflux RND transporter periplasmic adaptor subunit [Thiomicrorhabdus heinhorstiae]|uniref:Biotin/lipoyl-binding protein n=1 Tax=Thiomicrorhabdus heinhorstiae TaxID=2748010 RepID=A0ABS0BYL4_9GAMM|nr:biotin/lipoyl-binding protein [Thiomicrorhabdus heinhorstiae]MBF6058178.1 biotin/lipoyl-binding protein [Thiomicrorhabdus heinhorstiae]